MGIGIESKSDDEVHREAAQLAAAGDYGNMFQLLSALLARQRRELDPMHPALARTLGALAVIAYARGESGSAASLVESSIQILRHSLGPFNPTLVHRMREFAEAAEKAGDKVFAEKLRQRVAQTGALSAVNAISPLRPEDLQGFGNRCVDQGEFEEAERYFREAIRIWRNSPASRWDLASALSELGEVMRRTGRFDEAKNTQAEAYALVQDADAPVATRVKVLSNYGLINTKTGDFVRARQLYQQAINLERSNNPCSHDLGIAVFNLGALYEAMADVTTAERLYLEAGDILSRSVGMDHISFSLVANNLGNLYRMTGRPAAAENLLRRAVELRRYWLGDQHPWVAASLTNLGLAFSALVRQSDAAEVLNEAIQILERRTPPGVDLSMACQALAVVRSRQGDWASAGTLLEKAIRLHEAVWGPNHAILAHMLSNLAFARAACDLPDEALSLMERVAVIEDQLLESVAPVLSDEQRLGLLAQLSSHLTQVLAIIWRFFNGSPDGVRTAFRQVLTRKAISAEVMAARRDTMIAGLDPKIQAELRRLSGLSNEIGRLACQPPAGKSLESHIRTIVDLQSKKDELEACLGSQVPELRLRQRLGNINVRELASALPGNSVLIEFVKFEPISFKSQEIPKPNYYVFVLRSGEPDNLHFIEIGSAAQVDDLVSKVRTQILASGRSLFGRFRRPTFHEAGAELSRTVLGPLRPFLDGREHIIVSPDGTLNMLSFEALPLDEKRLVLDCFEVSYVASGRDILRFGKQGGSSTPAVVIADPNFDLADRSATDKGSADLKALRFDRLPGTREEGLRVAALLRVTPWLGNDALEGRLKRVSSPQIVHIATHGYFQPESVFDVSASNLEGGLNGLAEHLAAQTISGNPLLRSGLALAAANCRSRGTAPPEGAEDGLLTAFDVTGMNLTGTQLVVLSACVTGLGKIHPSEGTMGLRRSFTVAGAQAILVSLWNVPDRATKKLMLKLYGSLVSGMAPGAALRRAQSEMRRWNRNPYFWGGFVCHGDGSRPLAKSTATLH